MENRAPQKIRQENAGDVPTSGRGAAGTRVLVVGEAGVLPQIFGRELRRAGFDAVEVTKLDGLRQGAGVEETSLAVIVVNVPPTHEIEVTRWFRAHHPATRLLLIWLARWEVSRSAPDLVSVPKMIMPFTVVELIGRVGEILRVDALL